MSEDVKQENPSKIDFASLKLKPGLWLQLQSLVGVPHKCEVEFVAAVHGKSLFVAMAGATADEVPVRLGEQYLVRGFNGINDFTFTSKVLEIQPKPFYHAHLTFPDSVESKVVREALRLKTSLPAVAKLDGGDKQASVNVNDLSVAGAMLESATQLGMIDDRIEITISTHFEAKETELKIPAVIRHAGVWDPKQSYRCGVEFTDIAREDKLVLYYLMFTLLEDGR